MKHLFACVFIIIFVNNIFALSIDEEMAQKDLIKINEVFKKYQSISMRIHYSAYENYFSIHSKEESDGIFYKQGENQYSELMNLKTLNTKNYLIVVDTSARKIMIGNPIEFGSNSFGLEHFDLLLKKCKKVTQSNFNNHYRRYKLEFNNNINLEYNAIDIVFDCNTYFVSELVYYYRLDVLANETDPNSLKSKPRLEIKFNSISTKPKFPKGVFNESRFIEEKNQKLISSNSYYDYQIINNKISK